MNRYEQEFPEVPPYMMHADTDPSLIPDPDALESDDDLPTDREDEVNLESVVEEIEHERKEDDNVDEDEVVIVEAHEVGEDDDLISSIVNEDEEDEDDDVLEVDVEEDDEVIT